MPAVLKMLFDVPSLGFYSLVARLRVYAHCAAENKATEKKGETMGEEKEEERCHLKSV